MNERMIEWMRHELDREKQGAKVEICESTDTDKLKHISVFRDHLATSSNDDSLSRNKVVRGWS